MPSPICITASDTDWVSVACAVAPFAISDIDLATSSDAFLVWSVILSSFSEAATITSEVLPTFAITFASDLITALVWRASVPVSSLRAVSFGCAVTVRLPSAAESSTLIVRFRELTKPHNVRRIEIVTSTMSMIVSMAKYFTSVCIS